VERGAGGHDSALEPAQEPVMHSNIAHRVDPAIGQKTVILKGDERELCPYNFEGGGYVKIIVGGEIDTDAALDMIETQIKIKRAELKAKPKTFASVGGGDETNKDSGD
jgi:hypothetical protein